MAKFKKGDRVRCLVETTYVKKGATGTVDEDEALTPYVIWDSHDMLFQDFVSSLLVAISQSKIELIDEQSTGDISTLFEQYKAKKAELQALKNRIIELL